MSDLEIKGLLSRIADALDRLAPPPRAAETFAVARLYRYSPATETFHPAPDYRLDPDLLVGIERQKTRLVENLGRFSSGVPANHALLWGARGGGKSSLAKAAFMAQAQTDDSLRLVEVDSDDVGSLPTLFDILRADPHRFVVLCDDLSFEEGPGGMVASAKLLKSALEGGVGGPPQNVLFVATSNRRHLMPRDHQQNRGAIAAAEDAEEEVSVSDRFGLWIGFPPMDQATYLDAVQTYAARFGLEIKDLDRRALQWSQLRGGRSGRVAWQFTRDLAGEMGKALPL
jgi:predicted AAA+ superfamily ATPase